MILPGPRDFVFSAKTFAAAMLAVFIAFAIGLPHPAWAMLTVYIVASPFAGMVQSKALYRTAGSIIGASAAVVGVTLFIDMQELLCLFLACWVGLCIYMALLVRPPRNYAYLLAGYTAALVGFPSVDQPQAIFDTAVTRVEEIVLGLICLSLVNRLVFPQRVGPVLRRRIDDYLEAARLWTRDVLTGHGEDATGKVDRHRFVLDAASLDALRVHAAYDTPELRAAEGHVRRLQQRLQALFSVLVAIEDRITTLRRLPGVADGLEPLLLMLARRFEEAGAGTDDRALLAEIDRLQPTATAIRADRNALLLATLLARLRDLLSLWAECRELRAAIAEGRPASGRAPAVELHKDHLTAALAGLSAAAGILTCTSFWIASDWPYGGIATMMVAVACSLFAALDNPAAVARGFMRMSAVAILVGAVYVFGIFPRIDSFVLLAIVLAPFFMAAGAALAIPPLIGTALPLLVTTVAVMELQNERVIDFAAFTNAGIAQLVGIGLGVAVQSLSRPMGPPWAIRRLKVAVNRDLARLAAGNSGMDRIRFENRMFDRLHGLALRLAGDRPDRGAILNDALMTLRIGLNLIALRQVLRHMPEQAVQALTTALEALERSFRAQADDRVTENPLPVLDRALAEVSALPPSPDTDQALLSLAGIRHALSLHGRIGGQAAEPNAIALAGAGG
ncbi:FUSC family protein [Indioceanicola profundi]|uniref:FUSC family protein n=1 Tax=Indioceanicola profundi TaxID=2220096 RepID=UPI000E6AAD20|nr:FUSC family protein [Indioceanicola profundi]